MEMNFCGKRALVTGASRGIGREIVRQLAKCGATVVAVARNEQLLITLKEEIPSIETVVLDLTDWNRVKSELRKALPIDFLVNNAGLAILKPITLMTSDDIDQLFNINVKALINVSQIVSKDLLQRKSAGSIVNISSQASMAGLLNHSVYCSTKGAIDAFTRAMALELGPYNIRINCVNPTVIMTEMGKLGWSDPKIAQPMLQKIPLKRFGQVEDVVNAVLFLLSDKAGMITGTCLPVDGGYLAV